LKEAGHEIIPLPTEECYITYALEVVWKFFSFDNSASEIVAQGGEPPIPSRAVVAKLAEELGSRFVPEFEDMAPLERLSILNIERGEIIKNWHTLFRKYDLDAVICPPAPNTAVEHDMYGLTPYTSFLNLFDISLLPVATELWLIALINGRNSIQPVSSHFVEQGNFPT
jgi:amidase